MRKSEKVAAVLMFMVCSLLLTGWGEKAVELLDDTPLIILKEAIKDAPIGKEGNTLELDVVETESEAVSFDDQDADNSVVESEESERAQAKKIYTIEIRDKKITYDEKVCDLEHLKGIIEKDCSNGTGGVVLVDDYAETHVYNDVLTILKQLHESIKLDYREQNSD